MLARLFAVLVVGAAALGSAAALATDSIIADQAAAIKKGRFVCRLNPPQSTQGEWQAVLVKNAKFGDEWHVWFGTLPEPVCGFFGAFVKADGSYTMCPITVCELKRKQPN